MSSSYAYMKSINQKYALSTVGADHDDSSISIVNIVSAIKSMWQLIPVPSLSEDFQWQIVKQIKRNDGVVISRKDYQEGSSKLLALAKLQYRYVGHNCLFSGQETYSGIQVKDVKWNFVQRIVCIHIGSSEKPDKVAQSGSGTTWASQILLDQVLISISSVGSMPTICWVFLCIFPHISRGSNDFHRTNK